MTHLVKVYPYPNIDNFKTYILFPIDIAQKIFKKMVFEFKHYSFEDLNRIKNDNPQ